MLLKKIIFVINFLQGLPVSFLKHSQFIIQRVYLIDFLGHLSIILIHSVFNLSPVFDSSNSFLLLQHWYLPTEIKIFLWYQSSLFYLSLYCSFQLDNLSFIYFYWLLKCQIYSLVSLLCCTKSFRFQLSLSPIVHIGKFLIFDL